MSRPYKPTIPQSIGEIVDQLGWMMLKSPAFKHEEFPDLNIEMVFFELKEGLGVVRQKLGEERFQTLMAMSDRMRAHFEADPEDKTEDALAGRALIQEMEQLLKRKARA